jgi:hypothetical protein
MGNTPSFFGNQGAPRGRRVGADGLIEIKCRICERTICKEMYRGFSTAICAVCSEQVERGRTPQEIMEDVRVVEEKGRTDVYEDLGQLGYKVTGLGTRMKEVVQKIKQKAFTRKRKPLFAEKDKI